MAARLIQALQWPAHPPPISQRTLNEINSGWRKARESTSSSPSAIHFGHYMAGTFNPTIAIFNAWLANLGFNMGYSLKHWCTGLNDILEKQIGNLHINKLCIILLFKGNFNNNNKWLGCAVMFHAKKHNLLAKEQYGSRKEKLAAIQCLNKCLLYNYIWLTHIPLVICSIDAKSCYDCIVLMVAALCLCRLGAPKVAVQSMVLTIHSVQHHMQSSYDNLTSLHSRPSGVKQ